MYRTKKDVDRHVTDILGKIHNENERNLRGYNFARLYFQVRDHEDAKKHLTAYLSVRDHHAPSHKLMAQIYEAMHDNENALQSYKRSLEIDSRQKDVVLKICELYCSLSVDKETAKYWADRAEQLFPHNDIVFRLRECLVSAEGNSNFKELEKLISAELAAQPNNLKMRLKMLKLYLDTERVKEAFEQVVQLEKKKPFRMSTDWYYMLVDVFEAYQDEFGQELDFNFYVLFLTALDHLVYLTLAEPHVLQSLDEKNTTKTTGTVNDAAAALQKFDFYLKKASEKDLEHGAWLYFFSHMKGQLFMHLGCLVIKTAKKEPGKWKESNRIAAALFLVGYTFKPKNVLHEVWFLQMDEQQKMFTSFFHEGSLRTSFVGHTIISMCKEDKSKWLQKIKQDVCLRQVKERTYNRLFSGVNCKRSAAESFFQTDSSFTDSSLEFPSVTSLLEYDKSLYKTRPDSLHQLIWLHLHQKDMNVECFQNSLHEAFKGPPLKNNNLSKGSPESICLLDVESYLIAVIYTTNLLLDQKTALNSHNIDNTMAVPPFIAEPLCTAEQSAWWHSAYGLVNQAVKERFSEHRRILQHGLEVIRCVHNHGLEVQLVVHLARAFADKAAALTQDAECESPIDNDNAKSNVDKVSGLEYRAVHYWNVAISMLNILSNDQVLRVPQARMFHGYGKKLSSEEITALKEEGQLYLACRHMNANFLEEAVATLEKLTSAHASFYLALTYKKLAMQEDLLSNTRAILLHKAKDALYTTMDRVKGDTVHVLNEDLYIEVEDVEQEIEKQLNFANANTSRESYVDECDTTNISFKSNSRNTPLQGSQHVLHSTPRPPASFMTPRNTRADHRTHLEPSPERLDAQIRALASSQSTLVKTLMEQQRTLLETNKAIIDNLKQNTDVVIELKKKLEDLQISNINSSQKVPPKKTTAPKSPVAATSATNTEEHDEEDDECSDTYEANGLVDCFVNDTLGNYPASYNYSQPRMINSNVGAAAAMTYVPSAGLAAAAHPQAMPHYGYQYPPMPHGIAQPPHGAIPNGSHYYPSALNHGLPFTEGQPLPQFRFHVGSPMMKPPMFNNISHMQQPSVHGIPHSAMHGMPQSNMHGMPQSNVQGLPPGIPSQLGPGPPSQPWTRQGTVPHAFQIPLPSATNTTALSHSPHPPAVLSSSPLYMGGQVTPFMTSATGMPPVQKPSQPFSLRALLSNPSPGYRPEAPLSAHSSQFSSVGPSVATPPEAPSTLFSTVTKSGGRSIPETPETPGINRSRQDSDVYSDVDVEREVMGDFTPLIPLPAEVKVQTGEEDECVLFEARAKLFRFIDGEWKERGTGAVKLLKHKLTDHIRLLMRRDQVHKVCANHRLLPTMKILPLKGSDKALTWAAQDFADETVKVEQFCIRFKTGDIAREFKAAFDDAITQADITEKKSAMEAKAIAPPLTSPGFGSIGLPKTGSWSCPTCLVSNPGTKMSCLACDTNKPGSVSKTTEHSSNSSKSPFTVTSTQLIPATSTALCNFSGKPFIYQTPVISVNEAGLPKDGFGMPSAKPSPDLANTARTVQSPGFSKFSYTSSEVVPEAAKPNVTIGNKVPMHGTAPVQPPHAGTFRGFSFTTSDLVLEPSLPVPSETNVGLVSKPNSGPIGPPTSSVAKPKDDQPKIGFGGIAAHSEKSLEASLKAEDAKPVSMLGGFTFTIAPVLSDEKEEMKEREILIVSTKSKDGPQVTKVEPGKSPFSGFTFKAGGELGKPSAKGPLGIAAENHVQGNDKFVFGSNNHISDTRSTVDSKKGEGNGKNSGPSLFVTVGKDGRRVSSEGVADAVPEEFVPTAEFEPAVPMPALVDVKTGEENEEKLFGERVRLYRFDPTTKEWKERGIGEMKVLHQKNTNKYRILMRREQVLKICANHYIYPEMKLSPLPSSDKSWVWVAQDFSDGDLKQERFAARFKTPLIAQEFYKVFEKCQSQLEQQKAEATSIQNASVLNQVPKDDSPCTGNKMFSDLFKPAPESWECTACYVRNENNLIRCKACETLRHNAVENKNVSPSWSCAFCQSQTNRDSSCTTCGIMRKVGSDITVTPIPEPSPAPPPLSQMFKPDPGSWECNGCYTRNDQSLSVCVACETPKPGTVATAPSSVFGQLEMKSDKPFSAGFVFGANDSQMKPTFTFGTFPNASNSANGFSVPVSSSSNGVASFGGKPIISTSNSVPASAPVPITGFVFGKQPSVPSADFGKQQPTCIFGQPPSLKSENEQPNSPDSFGFKFGSPQKYEFNFSGVRPRSPSKCPKSPKSPGTPTDVEEEEEEVEQSDVDNIYFQPVIPLPPKVDVKTGEEEEDVLFTKRAKLFRFVDGEWKERGIGDVKILFNPSPNSVRLLMRRDQVHKVCLNHCLSKDIAFKWKSKTSLSWAAADFSENEQSLEQFAIRFKTEEFAKQFKEAVESAIMLVDPSYNPEPSPVSEQSADHLPSSNSVRKRLDFANEVAETVEDVSKQVDDSSYAETLCSFSFSVDKVKAEPASSQFSLASRFGSPQSADKPLSTSTFFSSSSKSKTPAPSVDSDVEFVYETVPTAEQREAAEKLMLPPTFYLYENKKPCPGCIGCEDDESSPQKTTLTQPVSKSSAIPPPEEKKEAAPEAINLFSNTTLSVFSFADLASQDSSTGFSNLASTSSSLKAAFPGAGAPVFGNTNQSNDDEDGDVAQGPDIHFEPVIPLPSLIEVKTGEEDELSLFCQRAKLYRYDGETRQWKERGVGEMKILQHKEKCRYRLLMRRDQVHKVACNHAISSTMELNPMNTSESSVCWSAIDYSENRPENSQFAIRFKNKEILQQFKSKFEECKYNLPTVEDNSLTITETAEAPAAMTETSVAPVSVSNVPETVNAVQPRVVVADSEDDEYEDDGEPGDGELYFEDMVSFAVFNDATSKFEPMGTGHLQILFDNSVSGYRITVKSDSAELMCNHAIALETRLSFDNLNALWAAIDSSVQPERRRQFIATFPGPESLEKFTKVFEEGIHLAEESEIVEKSDDILSRVVAHK